MKWSYQNKMPKNFKSNAKKLAQFCANGMKLILTYITIT